METRDKLCSENKAFVTANDSLRGRVLGECGVEE